MGLLRFLLAVSVLLGHGTSHANYALIHGDSAVIVFFIISGFYISLILNERYSALPYGEIRFIANRFLRLFPAYFIVLLVTFLVRWLIEQDPLIKGFSNLGRNEQFAVMLSNFFMLGIDWVQILASAKFVDMPSNWRLLPQAWSLSTELTFYLLAPLLIMRVARKYPVVLVLVALLSLLARYWFYQEDLTILSYRYFPALLVFFCFGWLSYRLYRMPIVVPNGTGLVLSAALVVYGYAFGLAKVSETDDVRMWGFYLIVVMAIPFLFKASKKSLVDDWLGKLSYPIYVTHFFVISILRHTNVVETSSAIAFTLLFSFAIVFLIEKPLEPLRKKIGGL